MAHLQSMIGNLAIEEHRDIAYRHRNIAHRKRCTGESVVEEHAHSTRWTRVLPAISRLSMKIADFRCLLIARSPIADCPIQ